MKIAQIGHGGMGKAIFSLANEKGIKVVAVLGREDEITADNLENSDLAIECTAPVSVLDNIRKLAVLKKDIVIVTTGWYDQMDEVKEIVKKHNIRCIYSSNYSIGVNIYFKILDYAASIMDKFSEYDIRGTEVHHKNKVDSPSGTAKTIEEILLKNITRKTSIVEETLHRKIKEEEIHFSSTRGGYNNFYHAINFDSEADSIELSHSAVNRSGYAAGILKCAGWLKNQEPGFYTMDDFLEDSLQG